MLNYTNRGVQHVMKYVFDDYFNRKDISMMFNQYERDEKSCLSKESIIDAIIIQDKKRR